MKLRFALVPMMLATACGGGDDSGSGGGDVACTYPAGTQSSGTSCAQYHDASSDRESAIKSACTSGSKPGTVSDECSTTNLLGCCAMSAGGFDVETCSYTDDGTTASQQMSGCQTAGGTWSTTP
jgi:hypothetical protein